MIRASESILRFRDVALSVGFVVLATILSLVLLRSTRDVSQYLSPGEYVLASAPQYVMNDICLSDGTSENVIYMAQHGLVGIDGTSLISDYDLIFRIAGLHYGIDWRLLAAISYYESHFRHDIVSHRGAVGLMQVMPRIARGMGVRSQFLKYPLTNAVVSAGIIRMFRRMVLSLGEMDPDDGMAFMLVCYNSGMKHLQDAVSLARADGCERITWEKVAPYLISLNDPEVFQQDSVVGGQFHEGAETVAFVNAVMNRYRSYRELSSHR